MPNRSNPTPVGAPDPELKNSPIVEETGEDFEIAGLDLDDSPVDNTVCWFNDTRYPHGHWICSGSELLRCEHGAWVRKGSCDPDNP
ncbi:MAG TPA: DUF1496 domain-containing protein [Thiotrichales bacterium]|nr:DUF1496 domain-containing protein [Thiotrichales bacterium]